MALNPDKNAAYEALVSELDGELKALQVRYEQYFLGMERAEPSRERADLRRRLEALKREYIRNTGLKFRVGSLWQKYLSYERMWQRTVTEIEEGRYHRDVAKARMRQKARAEREAADKARGSKDGAEAPEAAAPTAAARAAARRSGGGDGLSDEKLERLYQAFITAKKRCKEDTSGLTLDGMRKSLSRQIPQIKAKHKASAVDFKVVIKGGKAVLKAVPR